MRLLNFIAGAAALCAVIPAALSSAAAAPLPLIGDDTRVRITADLDGLGLTPGLTGTAAFVGSDINFDITGGELDGLAGEILHEGSGVSLTAGGTSVFAGNFIIDTVNQQLLGDVSVGPDQMTAAVVGDDLPLFTFDLSTVSVDQLTDLSEPLLALIITDTLAGALTDVFGAPDLAGAERLAAGLAPADGLKASARPRWPLDEASAAVAPAYGGGKRGAKA